MERARGGEAGATKKVVQFIGAPFCEGQNLDGADLAPEAMRISGMQQALASLGWGWADSGDLDFGKHLSAHALAPDGGSELLDHDVSVQMYREWLQSNMRENFCEWARRKNKKRRTMRVKSDTPEGGNSPPSTTQARNGNESEVVNAKLMGCGLGLLNKTVAAAAAAGTFALTVGGDHSVAAGSISAMLKAHPDLCVVWVDAHADANTPATSPSMHYHGMPAAHLLGWFKDEVDGFEWLEPGCLAESRLSFIGLRAIDPEEGRMLRASKVNVYTMRDVDRHGIARVIEARTPAPPRRARAHAAGGGSRVRLPRRWP